jgi:hypothetical protein
MDILGTSVGWRSPQKLHSGQRVKRPALCSGGRRYPSRRRRPNSSMRICINLGLTKHQMGRTLYGFDHPDKPEKRGSKAAKAAKAAKK